MSAGADAATGRGSLEEVVAADSLAIVEEAHHWCRLSIPAGQPITLREFGGKFIDLMVSQHVLAVEGNEVISPDGAGFKGKLEDTDWMVTTWSGTWCASRPSPLI